MIPPEGANVRLLVKKLLVCAAISIWITDNFKNKLMFSINDDDMFYWWILLSKLTQSYYNAVERLLDLYP